MKDKKSNSEPILTLILSLINFAFAVLVIAFGYLLLEDQIQEYINKPQLTAEQLKEFSDKRRIKRLQERNDNWDLVENGIHIKTGLKSDPNLQLIISSCTSCHSAKLITQNRASRQGWKNMIDWMQETQGLTDLGSKEPAILDYLAKYYSPKKTGRRANLDIESIKWYVLNLD